MCMNDEMTNCVLGEHANVLIIMHKVFRLEDLAQYDTPAKLWENSCEYN